MKPAELGRGIVVRPGTDPGAEWQALERLRVGEIKADLVDQLQRAWLERRPMVLELALPAEELRQPERQTGPVYALTPQFRFVREQLHFLVWANNYDATAGSPIWWHGRLARRLGAQAHPDADIAWHGPQWVDGGPRSNLPFPLVHRESVELGRLKLSQPLAQGPAELAPDQLQAVLHRGGAACVLAPAGSGKTRVLTERLRHLLATGIEVERITALAYNRRAALEMRARVPEASSCIRTLHALGYSLLRRHRSRQLASERDLRSLLTRLIKPPARVNQDPLQAYLEALQRIRLGLLDPQEVEAGNPEELAGLARAFPLYREALAERGWLDHDEQIYAALELLLEEPEIRKQAQRSCTHLLVDEFQDLTPAFVLMVRLLSGPAQQVFGVGDDDQVIYGYAGASPEYLVNFSRYFPGASQHQLQVNYRCPAGIVEAARHLLSFNRLRVPKDTRALPEREGGLPELILSPTPGLATLERVQSWLEQRPAESVAVLARVNSLLMPIQVLLSQNAIPHTAAVDASVLQRTGLRSALAYLNLALERYTSADLSDALRRPNRMLRRELIEQASHCSNANQLRRFALQQEGWVAQKLDDFCDTISLLKGRLRNGLAAFFGSLRKDTDFLEAIEQLDHSGLGASGGSSHRDDLLGLEQSALAYSGPATEFEEWLRDHLNRPRQESGIRLSSIHRVKGLEWPCVILHGLDQGTLPHRLSLNLEEERRILHVALTRAREKCLLIADSTRPSNFVRELCQPKTPAKKKKKKKKRKPN